VFCRFSLCSVFYVHTVIWAELPEINLMMMMMMMMMMKIERQEANTPWREENALTAYTHLKEAEIQTRKR